MAKLNCWEFKKCGREPGGDKVSEFGICPVALEDRTDGVNNGKHAGRACWVIAGTFCGGKIQGTSAVKIDTCMKCDFYKAVLDEEKLNFQTAQDIQDKITRHIFTVGQPLQLNSKKHKDVWTNLTGWEANTCLIAQLPYTGGAPIDLFSRDKCTIRFINDDNAFGFETKVIHVQYHPIPLLFLRYPSVIKKLPFRRHKRLKVNIPAKLYYDGELAVEALVADISEGGCLLKVLSINAKEFSADKNCRLTFSILDTALERLETSVKNIHIHENMKMLGVEFNNISPENLKIIKSFLDILGSSA
ncbi:MAG: flagellar brake protein [Nitrospirae bacterium]|nr:flagellar brake protein [Nitrospirota bacterium]